ncbi:hypothetical protein BDW59DRAFT_154951 [Aspergillus cavernicola]|uniref:Uncharacterized protein n=1 Tax=Aspergillus cavernicola TaxID=176166 RepID=A0ABR4HEK3_9EURO
MFAIPMPPPGSHLPLSSPSSGAEASASLPIMSPAIPSQPSAVSHPTMACGLTSNATNRPSALSKPKLTLQTTSLPMTFGSSSTGLSLSLAAGPTASPTVRNTFKNAYEVVCPSSATASPSRSSSNRFIKPSSPYTSSKYQLPLGVKSILRNSPLESNMRRSNSVAPSGPTSTSRRVFFPTKKQVSYRYPLEEEVKNVEYTARHSDLVSDPETDSRETSSDDDSDYSTSSLVSSETTPSDDGDESTSNSTADRKKKKRKYRSAERQVRAIALMEGLGDPYAPQTPQTPRQGRLKRRREWRWTLGSLEEGNTEPSESLVVPVSETQTSTTLEQDPKVPTSEPGTPIPSVISQSKPSNPPLPTSVTSSDTSETNTALSSGPKDPNPPH